jgi:hypothetical protein
VNDVIDVNPALDCSRVTTLVGRPYPVQFRNQGAIDAWTRALGNTDVWRRWQDPGTLCWDIRQEISWQLGHMHPMSLVPKEEIEKVTANRRMLAVEISTNLKYHLNKGTVIEATAALETLLTNSDVDLSLPMSIVAPPYRAPYLRFGEAAMKYLKVPDSQAPDRVFDGVFLFLYPGLRALRKRGNTLDAGTRLCQQAAGSLQRPCRPARRDGPGKHYARRVVDQGSGHCRRAARG